ncbi:hypothetical protein EBU24_06615, partial [bacterium]|nr:hypothetical protein [bacterium]
LKTWSIFVVIAAVAIYTKLVDMFEKHKLFYIIISFYIAIFGVIGSILFIAHEFGVEAVGAWPLSMCGIAAYLATESFGSIIIALFWSFTVSSTKSDEAKRGFPFIITIGQVGTIVCSSLLFISAPAWQLYVIALCLMIGTIICIKTLIATVPKSHMVSDKEEKKSKPDFLAGFRLLFTKPYLMGVFVVSTFYEVAKFIVDYQMKSQGAVIPGFDFMHFLGYFGVATNGLAFVMALLGTSYVMKKYGLRICLLLYPAIFGIALISLYFYYQTGPDPLYLFWATFAVMMLVTATSYAVSNPVKEMMYIPTSKDAKFKTKGLIDSFGGRASKATGANIGGALNVVGDSTASIANLMAYGTLISLGLIGVWIAAAFYVGQKNAQLVRDNEIIQ